MEVLYYGLACDEEYFERNSKKSNSPYIVAQQMFEVAMLEELEKNKDINLSCNYILQDSSFPKSENLYIKSIVRKITDKVSTRYISYLNLPGIKFISLFISTFIRTFKWCVKYRDNKEKVILSAVNYLPVSYANMIVSKMLNVKNTCIFTDTTSFISLKERVNKMSFIKRIVMPIYMKLVNTTEVNYDGYIFFSKYMNEIINEKNRDYCVMEGIFNSNNINFDEVKKEKAIMYAGSLFEQYGIRLFLDAFKLIEDPDLQLWIFGGGEMVETIETLAKEDPRIKYMGFRSREEVFNYEKKAKLLINTRFSSDLYTKMSFPSKTFEYMASGTPYLTTKIDGIPDEYYSFLYTVEDETSEGVKDSIKSIIEKSDEELKEFGLRAREFVINNKNSKVQSKIISDFLWKIVKG